MQSIGMTNQQLRKMVILESLSYVLRAGIVGVAASGFLGLTLVKGTGRRTIQYDDIPDDPAPYHWL